MRNKKFLFFLISLFFLIYLLIFDNYGLIKYFSLDKKLKEIEEKRNVLVAKDILYKERIKFLRSKTGKKLSKYF